MSKVVEDDIENIVNFLDVFQRLIEAQTPLSDDFKKEVLEATENKSIEDRCREILFSYFSKKEKS